jgi:DNA-binding transcriptional ArsR family regulator
VGLELSKIDLDLMAYSGWLRQIADPVRLEIIQALAKRGEATAAELAGVGVSSKPTLRRHLDALVSVGLVRRHSSESDGTTPGRPPVRFSLSSDVRESVCAVLEIRV